MKVAFCNKSETYAENKGKKNLLSGAKSVLEVRNSTWGKWSGFCKHGSTKISNNCAGCSVDIAAFKKEIYIS